MTSFRTIGLRAGIWESEFDAAGGPGRIVLSQFGEVLAEADVAELPDQPGRFRARVHIPGARLTDGVQTFTLSGADPDAATTNASAGLGHLTLIAGETVERDIRAELNFLRAEVDLLKRELRKLGADRG